MKSSGHGTIWLLIAIITIGLELVTAKAIRNNQHSLQLDESIIRSSSLLSLHKDLVEIESISGNENHVGEYLKNYLRRHNFTVETQLVAPLDTLGHSSQAARYNLLAYPGNRRDTRILVSSHIDTVPPYWPYEVRHHDNIWGRGSVDAKGCVATQITALHQLLASGDIEKNDVALLFVVGEELGGDGMKTANELGLKWEAVIFGEPTELKLASGHKGVHGFKISAKGKAGHSGYPWLGENANSMLIPALLAFDNMQLPSSEKYGKTTLNIGRMEGGVAPNVIAETAHAQIMMRLAAGTPKDTAKIVLDTVKAVDERLEVKFFTEGYGPVHIDSDIEGIPVVAIYHLNEINLKQDLRRSLSIMARIFQICMVTTNDTSTVQAISS